MQALSTTQHGGQRVRNGQIVVVVCVEIKVGISIPLNHLAEVLHALQRVHNSQRIGQHKSTDAHIAERIHQLINIVRRLIHAVAPILEIQVHDDALRVGVLHLADDIIDMLLGRLLQLIGTMFQRALGQQIQRFAATLGSPVNTLAAIDKSQHLYPLQLVDTGGIAANHLHRLFLTLAHSRRCHFYAVYVQVVKQHTGDDQLLVRQKTHAAGLFAIAQRRVHNLHKGLYALVLIYLFACSHNSVFCLF